MLRVLHYWSINIILQKPEKITEVSYKTLVTSLIWKYQHQEQK